MRELRDSRNLSAKLVLSEITIVASDAPDQSERRNCCPRMPFKEITDAGREKKEVVETRKVKLASQTTKVFSQN